ncbi:DUF2178 domain-containing protein [Streptomyces boncukensis]|uniref:DUF2178 domain-containing protein n=1 Tax=Streptomyces boncukensis TaxID=2711219 RepID=A0A6G4WNL9_9ACTN|nr:DUF2178 domain-containing protein [Streptomyces boncukensis]NGO66866.1 DUF2178 domain-containing protein [Streptomyces boncukensis]
MSTDQQLARTRGRRWLVPAVGLLCGVGYVAVFLARGDPGMAAGGFAIMAGYTLFLVLLSRRSEAVALLRGEVEDERRQIISLRAAALTGHVLILVVLTGFAIELTRGNSAHPWDLLAAVGGVTYLLATVFFTRRG